MYLRRHRVFEPATTKISTLLCLLFLAICGCAAEGVSPAPTQTTPAPASDAGKMLQPYLGTWRPTSFAEEMNVGSLTITASGLSIATGGSLTFQLMRREGEAVILRVTGQKPASASSPGALAFKLEQQVRKNDVTGAESSRQLLWIYWCDHLEDLAAGLASSSCSRNRYVR